MSVVSFQMKTHKREDITSQFLFIHDCAVHNVKPTVWHIVAGRRKESHWVVECGHDECTKITMENAETTVTIWNNYNPLPEPINTK